MHCRTATRSYGTLDRGMGAFLRHLNLNDDQYEVGRTWSLCYVFHIVFHVVFHVVFHNETHNETHMRKTLCPLEIIGRTQEECED